MTDRLDIARKIVEETCPHRRLKLENIQMFSLSRVRSSISTLQ